MKHFGRYTLLLCLLLTFPAYANITINGETVSVETDGYAVQFDKGAITYIHNKLTDETYTLEGTTAWTGLLFHPDIRGNIVTKFSQLISSTQIDRHKVELLFRREGTDIRLFIAVDPITDDLLIDMEGESSTYHVVGLQWGLGALDIRNLSVIVPSHGGRSFDATTPGKYWNHFYPSSEWEAQLAIVQGERGGFYVRNTDNTFRFKRLRL